MGTRDASGWRKSSHTHANGGNCVEVGHVRRDMIAVRDTKNRAGAVLNFSVRAWRTFAAQVKRD